MFSNKKKTILLKVHIFHIYNTYYRVACLLASYARYRMCYLQKYKFFFCLYTQALFASGKENFRRGKRKLSFDTFD